MKRISIFALALTALLVLGGLFSISVRAQSNDTSPPDQPVKLIFIHHSTGANWLADGHGDLGRELAANNYFVSDTNYGWGPEGIGDRTDIVNWREWFTGPESSRYTQALYNESGQHSGYTRTFSDPGGENQIVMFKSCFPNSALRGSPNDPPDSNEGLTVGHAKYVYNDLLNYFSTRPGKLFIVITAPPLQDSTHADNARAFNNWLVYDWLAENNYPYNNVAVFDFYNTLTHPDNHHQISGGQIEHISNNVNTLYYDSDGDNHPNTAGSQKASAEFIPLLNLYYRRWMAGAPAVQPPPAQESTPAEEVQTPPEGETQSPDSAPADLPPSGFIDDFEGTPPPETDGWQAYWDEATVTQFDCALENEVLRIDFDIAAESWATCTLFYDTIRDWSQFQGIAFSYQADAPARVVDVTVHGGTPEESTSYQYTVETVPESVDGWVPIDLTWNQLLGVDWEADARNPIDPSEITGVSFGFSTYEGTSNTGTLWIEDLRLIGAESELNTDHAPDEAQIEDEGTQPETEPEAPSQGGGGLCPNSIGLGMLALVAVFQYRKKSNRTPAK